MVVPKAYSCAGTFPEFLHPSNEENIRALLRLMNNSVYSIRKEATDKFIKYITQGEQDPAYEAFDASCSDQSCHVKTMRSILVALANGTLDTNLNTLLKKTIQDTLIKFISRDSNKIIF